MISFASVVVFQVIKSFNAHRHLYTLNKHRQNSLQTFQAFVEATEDQATRDAVLIHAAKAIFEAGETGFISQKEGSVGVDVIPLLQQLSRR